MKTVLDSLNSALHQAMAVNDRVILIGEDVLDPYGGAFKVTRGLSDRFPDRVLAAPVSEAAQVGIAAGMAMRGLRPVVEIMFGDFLTLAADQLINHAAKFNWMYNDQVKVPMVVRTPMGGRRGYGPTHSQTLEKLFLGAPGLTIVAPSNLPGSHGGQPADLLSWAILDQDSPVLFIENKLQYLLPLLDNDGFTDFELENDASQLPTLKVKIRGAPPATLTLTAYGYMAELARQAQLELAYEFEIFSELIIPTRIAPFNTQMLIESVYHTHRLLAIEEGTRTLGWGAEILAQVAEVGGLRLDNARRIAAADSPIPAASRLEAEALPGISDITQAARRMV